MGQDHSAGKASADLNRLDARWRGLYNAARPPEMVEQFSDAEVEPLLA